MKFLRTKRGISSVAIVLIAAVAIMWLVSLCAVIVPSYNEISRARQLATLRMDLESALNWAVDELSSTDSAIDDKTPDGQANIFQVPNGVVSDGSHVTVSVNNVPPATDSGMYSQSLDNTVRANNIAENGWRVIVAQGTRSNLHKSMRAILMPAYGNGTGPQQAIFDYALFATGDMTVDDGVNVSVVGDPMGSAATVISSNNSISIAKNTNIPGSVKVTSVPYGSNSTVLSVYKGATIHGVAQTNGMIDLASGAKVLNEANDPRGAMQQKLSMDPDSVPSIPSAPANATNLGELNIPLNGKTTLNSGNYVISKLEMGNGAELAVNATPSAPVNIYIQNHTSGVVINAGNSVKINVGGNSGNVRIWYPGNSQMNIGKSSVVNAVIAAPSSRVQVGMSSAIRGAIIGNKVHIKKNSTLIYDASLKLTPPSDLTFNLGPKKLDHREAVSWQELDQ